MNLLSNKKQSSIDLLKDEEKVKSTSQKKIGVNISVVILLLVALLSFSLLFFNFFQKFSLNQIRDSIKDKEVEWNSLQAVGTGVKTIMQKDQVISQTNAKYIGLDKKLDKVRELLPESTSLATLSIDSTGKVLIFGKSDSAATVYQLHEILKADKEVVNPVLESLQKTTTDYTFNISFTINSK